MCCVENPTAHPGNGSKPKSRRGIDANHTAAGNGLQAERKTQGRLFTRDFLEQRELSENEETSLKSRGTIELLCAETSKSFSTSSLPRLRMRCTPPRCNLSARLPDSASHRRPMSLRFWPLLRKSPWSRGVFFPRSKPQPRRRTAKKRRPRQRPDQREGSQTRDQGPEIRGWRLGTRG